MLQYINGQRKIRNPDERIDWIDGLTICDFWSWAYSDLFENTIRPIFAEFIVGHALGVVDKPREEWTPYDLLYRGKKIEVKSSGYLQSWSQKKLTTITFDISTRKEAWDPTTGKNIHLIRRPADIYVFALHAEKDEDIANILDLGQWQFYALSVKDIDSYFGLHRKVSLRRIEEVTSAVPYDGLREKVDMTLGLTRR